MISITHLSRAVLFALGAAASTVAFASPVFTSGVDNNMGFQAAANKTGSASSFAVGDLLYGVVNLQDISAGTTTWNANNVSAPYDSFTGYFVTRVAAVQSYNIPGFGAAYYLTMGAATNDPNGVFSNSELAAGAMVKLFTDSATPYTSGGTVANDIAHATDGTQWATLGFGGGGYWNIAVSPPTIPASGSIGGLNMLVNNTGSNWDKVIDTNCPTQDCAVDMKFVSTFSRTGGGAWHPTTAPIPLPGAVWLLGSGLVGLLGFARKRTAGA
jgi:hypothetical protein